MPDIQLLAQIFNDNSIAGSQLDNGNDQSAYPKAVLPILELALRTGFTTQGAAASASRQQDRNPLGLFSKEDITKIAAETKSFITSYEQIKAKRDLVSKLKLPKIPKQRYSSQQEKEQDQKAISDYRQEIKSEAAELANNFLEKLKVQPAIYVPGGWLQDKFGGHAVVYKITQIRSNELTFEVFNTGAGSTNHSQQDSSLSVVRYKPLHCYKMICPNTSGGIRFCLSDLLEFKLHDIVEFKKTYERRTLAVQEKKTHEELLYDAFRMPDERPDEVVHESDYIRGQFSGTCAIRSFDLMLRDLCKNDDSILSKERYQQLKFFIKTKVLEQYLDHYSQNPVPQVAHDQITRACQNFSWAVTKQSRLMTAERFESIYGSPKYVRSLIENHQLKIQQLVVDVRPHQPIDFSKLPKEILEVDTSTTIAASLGYKSFNIAKLEQIIQERVQESRNFSMHAYVTEISKVLEQGPYVRYEMMHLLGNLHSALEQYILPETFEELSDVELDAYIKFLTLYIDVSANIYGARPPSKFYAITMAIITNILSKSGYYVFEDDFEVLEKQLEMDRSNPSVTTLDYDADEQTFKSFDQIYNYRGDYTLFHDEIKSLADLSKDTSKETKKISVCLRRVIKETTAPAEFKTDYQILYYYFFYELCRSNEREKKLDSFPPELAERFRKMLKQYDRQVKLNLILTLSFKHPAACTRNRKIVDLALIGDQNDSVVRVWNPSNPIADYRSLLSGHEKNRFDTRSYDEIENETVKYSLWLSTERFCTTERSYKRKAIVAQMKSNHNVLECFASEEFKPSSQQPSALSIIRLGYPHTNSDRAVNTLFSLFTGQDTLFLTEQDYQKYFEQILFTPEYLYKYFQCESSDIKEQLRYLNSVLEQYMQFFDIQHHADNKTFVFDIDTTIAQKKAGFGKADIVFIKNPSIQKEQEKHVLSFLENTNSPLFVSLSPVSTREVKYKRFFDVLKQKGASIRFFDEAPFYEIIF